MSALALLDRVEAVIRQGWCQGAIAVDPLGLSVSHRSDRAVAFCLTGAMLKGSAGGRQGYSEMLIAVLAEIGHADQGEDEAGGYGDWAKVMAWNDAKGRTKDEVLTMLDGARVGIQFFDLIGSTAWSHSVESSTA